MTGRAVLVVGAGGHARVAIEVLRANGWSVTGCLSRDGTAATDIGAAVIGLDRDLEARIGAGDHAVFPAIGDNSDRLAVAERVERAGGELVTAVSPHAVVSPTAVLGAGTVLMPGAVVNAGTVLGRAVIVNTNASIDHDCVVGDGVHVAPGVAVAGGVRVGHRVLLGIGSCVVPGAVVGDGAVVGAGAVVTTDIAPGVTVVGVPARVRERL